MNRYGYRRYSDSTLMSLTKREIIELLRVAEHNYFVTDEALENSAKAGRELAEKLDKHGKWVDVKFSEGVFKDNDDSNDICLSITSAKCSLCQRYSDMLQQYSPKMPAYCSHCGAKMDGDTNNET